MDKIEQIKQLRETRKMEAAALRREQIIREDKYVAEIKQHIDSIITALSDGVPVSNIDMDELAEKLNTQEGLQTLSENLIAIKHVMETVADKEIEIPNTVSIGNFTILLKGIRQALKDNKVDIPDNKKELEAIRKQVEALGNAINKQINQKITDWIPIRRVRVLGNREYWDDADWGGSPGGGGSSSAATTIDTSALATAAKQDTLIGHVDTIETLLGTPSTVLNGKKTVTTAGTRVALASSTASRQVVIQALQANTGTIYVGDSSVAAANGYELTAGQSIGIEIDNLSKIYIDASVNGEGVTYLGS